MKPFLRTTSWKFKRERWKNGYERNCSKVLVYDGLHWQASVQLYWNFHLHWYRIRYHVRQHYTIYKLCYVRRKCGWFLSSAYKLHNSVHARGRIVNSYILRRQSTLGSSKSFRSYGQQAAGITGVKTEWRCKSRGQIL
jgi:hypothetical protein